MSMSFPSGHRVLRLGTRGSALALWQAHWVRDRLSEARPDLAVEVTILKTRGDRHGGELSELGGTGHFTSELEAALADGSIDLAVHSLKDLPVADAPGLTVGAVPVRADPRDALVGRDGLTLATLPPGARVATSSPRRVSLLKARRPDLEVVPLRGNVDTRVAGVAEGRYDAVVVAAAALARLGLGAHVTERFPLEDFPPAPGQGALAVQIRASDEPLREAVLLLDDPATREAVTAERALLSGLGGGCAMAAGAYGFRDGGALHLIAVAGSADGRRTARVEETGTDPLELGRRAAVRLLDAGAREIFA